MHVCMFVACSEGESSHAVVAVVLYVRPSWRLHRPLMCMQVLRWLLAAQGFEQFLSRKFAASKRFGLEGCEALLPGLLALVEAGAQSGLRKASRSCYKSNAGVHSNLWHALCQVASPLSTAMVHQRPCQAL